ncbi:MAG: hypothetical protein ACXV4A_16210 [Actinomycetes bacterium]
MTTMLTGIQVTTGPDPLPGHGAGEGHDPGQHTPRGQYPSPGLRRLV